MISLKQTLMDHLKAAGRPGIGTVPGQDIERFLRQ